MDPLALGTYPGSVPAVGGGDPYGRGGGGPGDVYSPTNGFAPQSTQNQAGTDQMLAMAQTQMNSGQSMTPEVAQGVNQAYMTAAQQQAGLNTPQGRQPYLDNTNVNAAQGNYDALAKQLAAYDNMVLQPQFAGQNPGMPSDVPTNPFANNTPAGLSYLTPENAALPYNQGIYNSNPTYALTSQNNQRNSIVDVLGTLNKVLAKESARGTNKYTSDLRSIDSILGTLKGYMDQNTSLTEKKADLAMRAAELAQSRSDTKASKIADRANALRSDLATGIIQWGDAWKTMKSEFPGASDSDIDSYLGGKYNAQDPSSSTGWAREGAAQEYAQGLRYKQTGSSDAKQQAMAKIGVNVINSLDQVPTSVMNSTGGATALTTYTKLSRNIFGIPLTGTLTKDEQEQANLQSKYFALVQSALTAIQGSRPSDYDVKSYQQQLGPSIANPPQVNQDRINNLISLMGIQGQVTFGQGGNSGGNVLMTSPDGKQWNVPPDKVQLFKQNGYK